ncbi:hypothetical protein GLOIN_2v1436015, partial [Rhizophagus irregularis DAOM 181602=DAOM 197198]
GNVSELGNISEDPGESYLFFLTILGTFVRSGAFSMILEKPRERFIFIPGRTHNRSRSPRIGSKDWARWALVRRP